MCVQWTDTGLFYTSLFSCLHCLTTCHQGSLRSQHKQRDFPSCVLRARVHGYVQQQVEMSAHVLAFVPSSQRPQSPQKASPL